MIHWYNKRAYLQCLQIKGVISSICHFLMESLYDILYFISNGMVVRLLSAVQFCVHSILTSVCNGRDSAAISLKE